MLVHLICSFMFMIIMALLNDDALETGENVYKIASEEASEADFLYISALKTYNSSQISIIIYIVNKSLFVGTICP